MTQPLTAVERRVYEYLLDFTAENTFQPSIREIGRQFQIRSTKTVADVLQSLAAKGFIERDSARSRGVRLLGFSGAGGVRPVPYRGRIRQAGPPLRHEDETGYISMDRRFLPSDVTFMMKATGDGMAGAGILDGDYVLVDPAGAPSAGALVVVRAGDGTALRRLVREEGRLALREERRDDADSSPASGEQADIVGVVCGIFRAFHDRGHDRGPDPGPSLRDARLPDPARKHGATVAVPLPDGVVVTPGSASAPPPRAARPFLLS